MLRVCPLACGVCSSLCSDTHSDCGQWALQDACTLNSGYMMKGHVSYEKGVG